MSDGSSFFAPFLLYGRIPQTFSITDRQWIDCQRCCGCLSPRSFSSLVLLCGNNGLYPRRFLTDCSREVKRTHSQAATSNVTRWGWTHLSEVAASSGNRAVSVSVSKAAAAATAAAAAEEEEERAAGYLSHILCHNNSCGEKGHRNCSCAGTHESCSNRELSQCHLRKSAGLASSPFSNFETSRRNLPHNERVFFLSFSFFLFNSSISSSDVQYGAR